MSPVIPFRRRSRYPRVPFAVGVLAAIALGAAAIAAWMIWQRPRLQSLINGRRFGIGELELVSLQALRERMKSAGGLPGRLKVGVVTGDVRHMHRLPENAGALFQVASQFNLLEMTGPEVTPENGVTIYQYDHTQGVCD